MSRRDFTICFSGLFLDSLRLRTCGNDVQCQTFVYIFNLSVVIETRGLQHLLYHFPHCSCCSKFSSLHIRRAPLSLGGDVRELAIVTTSARTPFFEVAIDFQECIVATPTKIARMTLTINLDGNWCSFQLVNSASPLSVTDSAITPSARIFNSSMASTHHARTEQPWCLRGI